ncbi:hypothetical protein B9Q03_04225 [Candidatus Marsarchaeota G2 archaeon OSP_D]|uniref:Uncharacterized protein n=6 Tax=Candidatus Marsarchaeota group 2 TaxID=2203771 RepID=A0A2R6CB91_9ARCH|nr:MAG: hypothetical protein B9Q03_04225 [Candidatus Marsarchaeota G2 archaeon OSP_D]PSN93442.1 MAG: hypothetical protein B9Q09_05860 [Candidatus Marsarchaeota G2 archaeon ECH_B_SAG-C16]PSN93600.1 MAG: hypothetical protein B9Q06_11575 [Candidatus Marsarchaeota G2 archaeon ECH_B_2]PSN98011.1 MAG: hypothetical protein B9Q07_10995 [Candidatus Marsarchaeota G2 archaeon ECH_B_3]PSO01623.1 MAG: hypothetical protein B9Q05_08340 [Candidatus Marsarchaeota G2 archaeon ECH_B_1]PSO08153.1 MAG: hypothetica
MGFEVDTFKWFLGSKTYTQSWMTFLRAHEPFLVALGLIILDVIELGFDVHIQEGRLVKHSKTKEGSYGWADLENRGVFSRRKAGAQRSENLIHHWEYGVRISNKRETMGKLVGNSVKWEG